MLLFCSKKSISCNNCNKNTDGKDQSMEVFEYVKDSAALAILFTAAYLWMMIM